MCEHIEKLKNQWYVDGILIYLQRINVNTDFPEIYRIAHYCLYCGLPMKEHVSAFNIDCSEYRNAHLNDYFGSHVDGITYRFNLVTTNEYNTFRTGDPDYPNRTTVRFCPYCGEEQGRTDVPVNEKYRAK